ncbi:hypothetical protein J4230_04280 [Candidatus Woesearchaeota archaeon]|nr:hypothetical protein [Candidatus Woesearchaeota archaeon]
MTEINNYEVRTGLTLDFKSKWGLERIILDSVSNHLPNDSKGNTTSIKVKQKGKLIDFRLANSEEEIEEVVVEDDGRGYDSKLLSTILSLKAYDLQSVGQFGEGLKGVSAASLRNNIKVQFRSRNWIAEPYVTSEVIEGKSRDILYFKIKENGEKINGSRTVFTEPPKELVKELLSIPDKILYFNRDYVELHNEKDNVKFPLEDLLRGYNEYMEIISNINSGSILNKKIIKQNFGDFLFYPQNIRLQQGPKYNSRIIDLKNGKTDLFVKNVRVKGVYSLYSYDLGIEEIASERNFANEEKVLSEVRTLLEGCANTEVIENVIKAAEKKIDHQLLELIVFRPIRQEQSKINELNEINKNEISESLFFRQIKILYDSDLWVRSFRKLYGENAILSSLNNFANGDAETMGYKVVKLDSGIAKYLQSKGIKNADQIKFSQEYRWVDDLTDEEKNILKECHKIDKYLGISPDQSIEVKVYSGLFSETGREIPTSLGVQITERDGRKYIGIKREALKDRETFVETYHHERGHSVTGAPDEDRAFADYFINKLAEHYMQDNPQ